jgi:hypothetical protein
MVNRVRFSVEFFFTQSKPAKLKRGDFGWAQGVVQHSTINNLAFGRSVDETLRVLQAIQYVQENPDEVCPAGWKPGDVTMKPTPKDSKEYFAAL